MQEARCIRNFLPAIRTPDQTHTGSIQPATLYPVEPRLPAREARRKALPRAGEFLCHRAMTSALRVTEAVSSHEMTRSIPVPRARLRPISVGHISPPTSPPQSVHYTSHALSHMGWELPPSSQCWRSSQKLCGTESGRRFKNVFTVSIQTASACPACGALANCLEKYQLCSYVVVNDATKNQSPKPPQYDL